MRGSIYAPAQQDNANETKKTRSRH